jgi:hypothetical protein
LQRIGIGAETYQNTRAMSDWMKPLSDEMEMVNVRKKYEHLSKAQKKHKLRNATWNDKRLCLVHPKQHQHQQQHQHQHQQQQ